MHHLFGLTELACDVPAQAETAACQSVKEHIEQDLTKDIWLWSTRWCVTPKPSARPREVLGNEMQCAHELAERSREASSQGSQNLPIHRPGGRLIMH
jgi:hypothetical protein